MPTKIVFSISSVAVVDEPHEVVTKLKQGSIQFESVNDGDGPIHLLNPALILYLQKLEPAR